MAERWDDHLRPLEGESNEDYWKRQIAWTNQEAIKLDAWLAGARVGMGIYPVKNIYALDDIPKPSLFRRFLRRAWQVITYPDSTRLGRSPENTREDKAE